jgi:hypothetical protein
MARAARDAGVGISHAAQERKKNPGKTLTGFSVPLDARR